MSHRIFIVEDHPVMREAYLSVLGFESDLDAVGSAESVEEALVVLSSLDCDLVVTDLVLPGQSGIDLVRALRAMRPDLPAVVITGHEEAAFERDARAAGAAAFLSKRDLMQTLVPTIHDVLAARQVAARAA